MVAILPQALRLDVETPGGSDHQRAEDNGL
jgi:hypothetical protein